MKKIVQMVLILLPVAICGAVYGGNYELTAGITQRGETLEVDGRVNSGPKCNNLLIRCSVISSQGQATTIFASTSYSGSGSALYDGKQRISVNRSKGLPSWNITRTSASCND